VFEVADDFAGEVALHPPAGGRRLAAQKAHHIRPGEGAQAVMDQAGMERGRR
jgi:hypothetical protein